MFIREDISYEYDEDLVKNILNDEASPMTRIFNLIPEGAKILDVGAGNGILAKLFIYKEKFVTIDGIEPNIHASNIAENGYRNFYNGYIQDFMSEILNEKYDFIVFADVLEHIADPVCVFKDFFKKLDVSTKVIISTPNVAFGAVRLSLMKGSFNYVDSGILEKTHLRFYTLDSLKKLVFTLGFNIEKQYYLNRNFNNTEINLNDFGLNPMLIYFVAKDKLSHVYQFLFVLSKDHPSIEEQVFGNRSKFPVLEYILKPIVMKNKKIKKVLKKFYKW